MLLFSSLSQSAFARWTVFALAVTSSACGVRGDGAGDETTGSGSTPLGSITGAEADYPLPRSCDVDDMKSWVYDNMNDYYLFYDQVDQNVALSQFDDVESLITQLRVQPFDTFSYITEETSHSARFDEGETFGFGWRLQRNQQDEFFFKLIEKQSPLARVSVQRGDQLVAINGRPMAEFLQMSTAEKDAALGVGDEAVTVNFTIGKPAGSTTDVTVTKATYPVETVLANQIVDYNNTRFGYLHFYQFLETSRAELQNAFTELASANISELVLDLRYNGGGRVSVANELASYIVGNGKTDQPFATYRPNDKYAALTSDINFINQAQALNLSRVFVLQSDETCSASELVVNGLRPFMDVITVGGTSCGKPYASIPRAACGKVMNALELESINAAGVGGYYDGIAADCPVSENISQALGSSSEALLKAAMDYASIGSCTVAAARSKRSIELPLPTELRSPHFVGSTF